MLATQISECITPVSNGKFQGVTLRIEISILRSSTPRKNNRRTTFKKCPASQCDRLTACGEHHSTLVFSLVVLVVAVNSLVCFVTKKSVMFCYFLSPPDAMCRGTGLPLNETCEWSLCKTDYCNNGALLKVSYILMVLILVYWNKPDTVNWPTLH